MAVPSFRRGSTVKVLLSLIISLALVVLSDAQSSSFYTTTFSGSGVMGLATGAASITKFYYPYNVVFDQQRDRMYVLHALSIFALKSDGSSSVLSQYWSDNKIYDILLDLTMNSYDNKFYVTTTSSTIYKFDPSTGGVSLYAGADRVSGFADGHRLNDARFGSVRGIAADPATGDIYVADISNHCIRRIDQLTDQVSTYAGTCTQSGYLEGSGTGALMNAPWGLRYYPEKGAFYFADLGNNCIRTIDYATGNTAAIAGNCTNGGYYDVDSNPLAAMFLYPAGLHLDLPSNILYVAERTNTVRAVYLTTGAVKTISGTVVDGFADGPLGVAKLNESNGCTVGWGGHVYIADTNNQRIRMVCSTLYAKDADGDGYIAYPVKTVAACSKPSGYILYTNYSRFDCNDTNSNVNPGATEICDNIDNNCNGAADEGFDFRDFYVDADGDGYGNNNTAPIRSCKSSINGCVTNNRDCDDSNKAVNPDRTEICNGIDDNCNGETDENLTMNTFFRDEDGDGYGDPFKSEYSCNDTSYAIAHGWVLNDDDCDDSNENLNTQADCKAVPPPVYSSSEEDAASSSTTAPDASSSTTSDKAGVGLGALLGIEDEAVAIVVIAVIVVLAVIIVGGLSLIVIGVLAYSIVSRRRRKQMEYEGTEMLDTQSTTYTVSTSYTQQQTFPAPTTEQQAFVSPPVVSNNSAPLSQSSTFTFSDEVKKPAIRLTTNTVEKSDIENMTKISKGPYWIVYKAELHGVDVIVKMANFRKTAAFTKSESLKEQVIAQISEEYNQLSVLRHSQIMDYRGVLLGLPEFAIITEYMSEGNLFHHLYKKADKKMSWCIKLRILSDVAAGMQYLHKLKVVHCNLTSNNIFLRGLMDNSNGRKEFVFAAKVADFGTHKIKEIIDEQNDVEEEDEEENTEEEVGYLWQAPEVTTSNKYEQASDVYSFAIVMSELLNEEIPFGDITPKRAVHMKVARDPNLRPALKPVASADNNTQSLQLYIKLMKRCWAQDPEERPTFVEIMRELNSISEIFRDERDQ